MEGVAKKASTCVKRIYKRIFLKKKFKAIIFKNVKIYTYKFEEDKIIYNKLKMYLNFK